MHTNSAWEKTWKCSASWHQWSLLLVHNSSNKSWTSSKARLPMQFSKNLDLIWPISQKLTSTSTWRRIRSFRASKDWFKLKENQKKSKHNSVLYPQRKIQLPWSKMLKLSAKPRLRQTRPWPLTISYRLAKSCSNMRHCTMKVSSQRTLCNAEQPLLPTTIKSLMRSSWRQPISSKCLCN